MNANVQSSQGGRGKNKRFWKKEEEEALIDCLLELSCDQQWKGEGGFKNGYLNQLELMLNTKFPGCGIKVIPHIESKFKWFKDKYAIVSEMVNKTSGFQWDEKTSTIQCERQAYDDFCKTHPKAGGLWKTPFPYLSKLDDIFGVDRANGLASELPEDSIHNLEKEVVPLDNDSDNEDLSFTRSPASATDYTQPQPPPAKRMKKEKTPKTNEKKRATRFENLSSVDNMAVGFTGFMKDMNNHLATIASAMSTTQEREQEIVEQKRRLLSEIGSLPGITQVEVIRAASLFSSNPSQMEIFFSSPNDEWKREVVLDLLSRNA
ncbi:HMG-CoA reductase inhibitor bumarsin [Bienertia sinuspersici]